MAPIVQTSDNLKDWSERTTRFAQNAKHLEDFDAFVFTDCANDVADLRKWVAELDGEWAFRGQRDHRWPLVASIDRASSRKITLRDGGLERTGRAFLDPTNHEKKMLDQFRGRAHHFLKSTPAEDDVLGWLALMQHYGAPTRMLDWSHSPYVATYFAIEDPILKCSRGHAVWAISLKWLRCRSNELLCQSDQFFSTASANDARKHAKVINTLLLQSDLEGLELPPVVVAPTNFRLNERQAAQQGLFLFGLNIDSSIRSSLLHMMEPPSVVAKPVLRKLILNPSTRLELLRELQRMNITAASLFPGLDGFSRGLKVNLELDVESMKRGIEKAG